MKNIQRPRPTGWDSLRAEPWFHPYGLPYFHGEEVSVSYGRLVSSYWYEHSHERVRLIFTFSNTIAHIETASGGHPRLSWRALGPNKCCLIPPGLETTLSWVNEAEVLILYVDTPEFGERKYSEAYLLVEDLHALMRGDPLLLSLMQLLATLSREPAEPDVADVVGIGVQLARRTLRQYLSPREPQKTTCTGLANDVVSKIQQYIDGNIKEKILATGLARRIGLSADHFTRRFKITTGVGPKQYVVQRKNTKVLELLLTGKFNVTEAAREVGFHDLSYLSRCFRGLFGCSPKSVQKNALATESYQRNADTSVVLSAPET